MLVARKELNILRLYKGIKGPIKMGPWVLIAFLIIIIAAILVLLAFAAAKKLLSPPRKKGAWTPRDLGLRYQDIEVVADDGVKLRGWFIDVGGEDTIIAIHGYTSSRWDETYMKPVIHILARNGFNVLAFDFRAHGESEGEYTTLGVRELRDYRRIISWLRNNYPDKAKKIGVIGYSMGGAVAIMLAATEDRIDAVVADSPYMDIIASGKRWIKRMKQPMRSLLLAVYPLIVSFASRIAGINTDELRIINYADKVKKPLLIIAGRRDDLVSINEINSFFQRAKAHGKPVELWITDSPHVRTIVDEPEEYKKRIVSFFRRWLS